MIEDYDALMRVLERRRSTRRFSGEPVSSGDVERILAAARTAPFVSGRKRWEVRAVTDAALITDMARAVKERISALAERVRPDFRQGFEEYSRNFYAFDSAPLVFVPVFRSSYPISLMLDEHDEVIDSFERDNYTKSISCVALLIILAAESLGLASCYMTGGLLAAEEIGRALAIRPEQEIGALIPVGRAVL